MTLFRVSNHSIHEQLTFIFNMLHEKVAQAIENNSLQPSSPFQFECNEDAPEDDTQWVKSKTSHFSQGGNHRISTTHRAGHGLDRDPGLGLLLAKAENELKNAQMWP